MFAIKAEDLYCAEFVDSEKWTCRYQRNNKSSGLKNLRCFPYCSEVHHIRGFCGRSVSFKFTKDTLESEGAKKKKIFAWAQFRVSAETEELDDYKDIDCTSQHHKALVGELLTTEDIKEKVRTKADPLKSWYPGEPYGGDATRTESSITFEFNRNPRGWNYGWVANKHTSNWSHILRVYVFEQHDDGTFECICTTDSPTFTLFCRRRERKKLSDLPVHLKKQLEVQEELKKKLSQVFGSNNRMPPSLLQDMYNGKRLSLSLSADIKDDSKRIKSQAVKRDEVVWKIIYALLKVDLYKKESKDDVKIKLEPKMDAKFDDCASITSFVDIFLEDVDLVNNVTKAGNDTDPLDYLFNNTTNGVEGFGYPAGENAIAEEKEKLPGTNLSGSNLLEELAKYLINEQCFTNAIENVFTKADVEGCAYNERKRMLIDTFAEQVDAFLLQYGSNMYDLEKSLSNIRISRAVQRVDANIATQIQGYDKKTAEDIKRNAMISKQVEWDTPIIGSTIGKISGDWTHEVEALDVMETVRANIGVSWINNKLFRKMEENFTLFCDSNQKYFEIKYMSKLMSTGTVKYVLDGKQRPFSLAMPLPLPYQEQMSYCAYKNMHEDSIILVINFNVYNRTVSRVFVDEDDSLMTIYRWEVKQPGTTIWDTRGEWENRAFKSR